LITSDEKPITAGMLGNLTKVSDELFEVLANS